MSLIITASEETLAALIPTLLERIRTLEVERNSLKATEKVQDMMIKSLTRRLKVTPDQPTDVFQLFATEKLVADTNSVVKVSDARIAFKEWARFNPGYPAILTLKQFIARLTEMPGAKLTPDGRVLDGYKLTEE